MNEFSVEVEHENSTCEIDHPYPLNRIIDQNELRSFNHAESQRPMRSLNGVVIGELVGRQDREKPLVNYPGNPHGPTPAISTVDTSEVRTGCQVALMFEDGDPRRPILIGPVQNAIRASFRETRGATVANSDEKRIVISADREVVLECGKASITLTQAGKIVIRGTYLLSRSSGVNSIKGATIKLN